MTTHDLKKYLNNGNSIGQKGVDELRRILDEYPFFQSAKILYTKGLKNINSLEYKKELEKTAISVNNRKRLYEFIIQEELQEKIETILSEVNIDEKESIITKDEIAVVEKNIVETEKENAQSDIKESVVQLQSYDIEQVYGTPEINTDPIEIPKQEIQTKEEEEEEDKGLSFSDWLSADSDMIKESTEPIIPEKSLIDNFISNQPKITPNKIYDYSPSSITKLNNVVDNDFTTETLARIYVTQKNYSKAITTYEQLSLKFPNKKAYFATQIENLKRLLDSKK